MKVQKTQKTKIILKYFKNCRNQTDQFQDLLYDYGNQDYEVFV